MRFLTAGESHGLVQLALVEGFPAGVALTSEPIDFELARRQAGYGRGARMAIEQDRVTFLSGVRNGLTTGGPIAMQVMNRDHSNWKQAMGVEPVEPHDVARHEAIASKRITRVRPGHADYAGARKYHLADVRDVLERSSARETTARVMVGALAGVLLSQFGMRVLSHVVELGGLVAPPQDLSFDELAERSEASRVRCVDANLSQEMVTLIDRTRSAGDTLGGVVEIIAEGLPIGLGSYVQWDRRLDGLLAQAVMSIPAIKGVEIGLGFELARHPGSAVHDPFYEGFRRDTNRAGGIEGGMTNGARLVIRAAMKPIPTLGHPLPSVDLDTGKAATAHFERSDVCALSAAGVVAEAMVRWVLACAFLDKVGGDSLAEVRAHFDALLQESP